MATLILSVFLVGSVSAAEISFSTLALNGAAQITTTADGEVLRLVSANKVGGQSGTAFTTGTVDTNTFSTSFSFRITESGGEGGGADGLMFILQTSGQNVVGAEGGFFGYQNHFSGATLFPNSLGVEFDSYSNSNIPGIRESLYQHVGIDTNGYVDSLVMTSDIGGSLKDGSVWYSWIDYNGTTLEVRLNQSGVRPDPALLAFDINLSGLLGGDSAYAGFGAGVGSGYGNHDILSWDYSGSAAPVPEPSTMLLLGSGLAGLLGYGRRRLKK